MLKIALIGCGIWGQKILNEIVKFGTVLDVYDENPLIRNYVRQYEGVSFFTKWDDLSQYDGVILATPSSLHANHLEKIIPFHIPIFVEKPLTASLDEALRLNKLFVEKIFLMHTWTYHPGILMLRDIISSNEFGFLHSVQSNRANWTSPRNDIDSLWNLAPHDITIAKLLFGYIPNPSYAIAERYNGVIRRFIGVLGTKQKFIFDVSNRHENKVRTLRLNFDGGVLLFDAENSMQIKVIHGDSNSAAENLEIEYRGYSADTSLTLEIADFIQYLKTGNPPRNNFKDGLEVIKVIDELLNLSEKS
jgi:predicted dehydrogenase